MDADVSGGTVHIGVAVGVQPGKLMPNGTGRGQEQLEDLHRHRGVARGHDQRGHKVAGGRPFLDGLLQTALHARVNSWNVVCAVRRAPLVVCRVVRVVLRVACVFSNVLAAGNIAVAANSVTVSRTQSRRVVCSCGVVGGKLSAEPREG